MYVCKTATCIPRRIQEGQTHPKGGGEGGRGGIDLDTLTSTFEKRIDSFSSTRLQDWDYSCGDTLKLYLVVWMSLCVLKWRWVGGVGLRKWRCGAGQGRAGNWQGGID